MDTIIVLSLLGLIGLIILCGYLKALWKKSYDFFLDKLSFSAVQSAGILYPSLHVDEKFQNIKYRGIAKFMWFVLFVIIAIIFDNLIVKIITSCVLVFYVFGDFLLNKKIKKDIEEILCEEDSMETDYFVPVKKAFKAMTIYQLYLYLVFLFMA